MIKLFLENRSLAENNPLNLCTLEKLDRYCQRIGEEEFIRYVNEILDLYE